MKDILFGNHTVNHKSMPEIDNETIKKEVMELHTSIYEKCGFKIWKPQDYKNFVTIYMDKCG